MSPPPSLEKPKISAGRGAEPVAEVRAAARVPTKPRRWWSRFFSGVRKAGGAIVLCAVVLCAFAVALGAVKVPWLKSDGESNTTPPNGLAVELVQGKANSLLVPPDVQKSLGILHGKMQSIAVAAAPCRTVPLEMPGSTALDPSLLIRVRVRFAPADVVEIGKIDDPHGSPGSVPPLKRELQAGDPVKRGDLLAVLFSIDVGNKKNDLFDALSQLRLDEDLLKRAEAHSSAVPEVFLLNARRNVEADLNAVNRAENTLKTWDIPEKDIKAVRDDAKSITDLDQKHAAEKEKLKQWARVELRAPDDGFIIEQNAALHETIIDNTTNLFQIAKVDPLVVLAAVPEDDLPALNELKRTTRNRIPWLVRTVGTKPVEGYIDDISYLIDPNQHTAVVRGHIHNPDAALRAGQFVTASVDLLPPDGVVEIPIDALAEDGNESAVFVQSDAKEPIFTMRRVQVVDRFDRTAYVRATPLSKQELSAIGKQTDASPPTEPLRQGERVLTAGVLELKTALADKLAESGKP